MLLREKEKMKNTNNSTGMGCAGFFIALLQVTLIVLKIIGYLPNWNWILVLSPIWLSFLLPFLILFLFLFFALTYISSCIVVFTLFQLFGKRYSYYSRNSKITIGIAFNISNFIKNTPNNLMFLFWKVKDEIYKRLFQKSIS